MPEEERGVPVWLFLPANPDFKAVCYSEHPHPNRSEFAKTEHAAAASRAGAGITLAACHRFETWFCGLQLRGKCCF